MTSCADEKSCLAVSPEFRSLDFNDRMVQTGSQQSKRVRRGEPEVQGGPRPLQGDFMIEMRVEVVT
jgi:hypothetical protein